MSLRAIFLAGVLTMPALAACSRVADHTALPSTTAEAAPAETPDLAGGPDAVGDAAQRAAMDAAVAAALSDAEAARTPPVRLIISNTPIPNPGDPVRPAGVLRIAMAPVPNPEAAPGAAPALLGAPEDEAPAMELAGAPEKPRHVGAMVEAAAEPTPRPASKPAAAPARRPHATLVAAAPPSAPAPAPAPAPEPIDVAAAVEAPPPATPMEAVLGTAAPPPPEEVELPRVAAGVTPADTDGPMSPLVWLSGLAVVVVGGVFAAVRLIRREREPLRA